MSRITPWESSDIVFACAEFKTSEQINTFIDSYLVRSPIDHPLLEGIRYASLYYVRLENSDAEQCCMFSEDGDDMTMKKLINDEIPFITQVGNPKINGMAMVIQYKNYFSK
ncbi:Hypothetical protein ORPV_247 [Orpheovirus IHUMI-LCC2]|uniref:Uncharacterized protein n=1 Tax=Orpheovirus IHUMI-LCC2 TaxID=2023057 RepID=A0A2I2L3R4_9VIRU|nr:Hypothetical protein ORPV_247 [Orpheovirus IHUMI-LCC2]SNW62151.1 Hypothetical protein ORPV_247 [Orpheovirus IHUMI-LCC2]